MGMAVVFVELLEEEVKGTGPPESIMELILCYHPSRSLVLTEVRKTLQFLTPNVDLWNHCLHTYTECLNSVAPDSLVQLVEIWLNELWGQEGWGHYLCQETVHISVFVVVSLIKETNCIWQSLSKNLILNFFKNWKQTSGPWVTSLPEQQFQSINTFAQSNGYAITLKEQNVVIYFVDYFKQEAHRP